MGIRTVKATEVSCQRCTRTILVEHWWEANQRDWVVPSDGHLQLCPECNAQQQAAFQAAIIQHKSVNAIRD